MTASSAENTFIVAILRLLHPWRIMPGLALKANAYLPRAGLAILDLHIFEIAGLVVDAGFGRRDP